MLGAVNHHAANAARLDAAWLAQRVARLPPSWAGRIVDRYGRLVGEARAVPSGTGAQSEQIRQASIWLLGAVDDTAQIRIPLGIGDGELCELARGLARKCLDLAGDGFLRTVDGIRGRLAGFVRMYGIAAPALPYITRSGKRGGVEDGPAIARMTDELWWRRALRRHQARELERVAIGLGYVRAGVNHYASNETVLRRKQQVARNAESIANTRAINEDTGEVLGLSELVKKSVANPKIRHGELMTRVAGFERVAQALGHVADFVTLTCPSAYHSSKTIGKNRSIDNKRYNRATPRMAQSYLCRVWARIRAKLARMGVRVYGLRVAEPHKDGTPHWHMVLFMPRWLSAGRSMVGRVRAVIRRYALREDGDETGARARRCSFEAIDPAQGSAVAYIAKYISKNIHQGLYEVQGDLFGNDAFYPSARVVSWASTWGIRQFQQIGGPPVGVWREARRMSSKTEEVSSVVAEVIAAADVGQKTKGKQGEAAKGWARYVMAQGGPVVDRKALAVRVARTRDGERWDSQADAPCPAPLTRYGEVARGVVFGVCDARRSYSSGRSRWVLRRVLGLGLGLGFGGARRPWTGVNNCTQAKGDSHGAKSGTGGSGDRFEAWRGHGDGFGWRTAFTGTSPGHDLGHGGVDRRNGAGDS